jgi:long-chain acyl-CoA synthetase
MSGVDSAEVQVDAGERRREMARQGLLLSWWAEQQPDRAAIISSAGTRTFGQLDEGANRLARALRRRGVAPGDSVALICGNRPEFAEMVAAGQRSGLRLTPVNWHLSAAEAAYIVADCGAKALVADATINDEAVEVARAAPDCEVRLAVGGTIEGFEDYDEACGAEDGSRLDDALLGSSMLYTSGTSGRPKGVHRPVPVTGALAGMNFYGYGEDGDLHLCTGPLYHAAPLAFSLAVPLAFGVGVVLMDHWDAEEALRLVEEHRVTHTHMVPTMFHRLLSVSPEARERYDVSSLRFVIHGAAPCPVAVKQGLIDWLGPIVWEYYAATEGTASFVDSPTWLEHPGTVGKPLAEGLVMIGDDDGKELAIGEIGLVYIRAPREGRFEYYGDPEKTAGSYRGDYFTLGDMGYLDDEGYLFLTDRSVNLIISGGVNIYPAEVDAALLEHASVGDAATIGVPDAEWGEQVKAVVELQPGVEGSDELAAELIEHCRSRLAHYKCPRTVDFVVELPRQDNGKIYKRLLRDQYRAGT